MLRDGLNKQGGSKLRKYVLIVSQMSSSYNLAICEVEQGFTRKAVKFVKELEEYKRQAHEEWVDKEFYFGCDSKDEFKEDLERYDRVNINDISGDIYFIFFDSFTKCIEEIEARYIIGINNYFEYTKYHKKQDFIHIVRKYFKLV